MSHVDPAPEAAPLTKTSYAVESFGLIALVLVVGIFASTLPQPQVLGKLPLQHILKSTLHATREQTAFFFFLCGIFWYLKPIAGILTDSFPLFKTRRRYYVLISSALAGIAWIVLGLVPVGYDSLLVGAIIVNLFMVMISTVMGAFLVEIGQSRGEVGKLTAIRMLTQNFGGIIQGPLGGWFASIPFLIGAGVNAVLVMSILPVAFLLMKEKPVAMANPNAMKNAGNQFRTIGKYKPFWLAILFIGLYYFAPGFGTMQYYRQNDVLHFSQQTIGYLGSVGAVGGILAGLVYVYAARRIALKSSLLFGIATAGTGTLLYLFYNSLGVAWGIDFQNGFFASFAEIALMDLAARGTPAGCEGLGFSLMMSMRNISLFGADWLGAHLADQYKVSWATMVFLNAGTTLFVLVLLPFLPASLVKGKDNEKGNPENTGEPEPEAA